MTRKRATGFVDRYEHRIRMLCSFYTFPQLGVLKIFSSNMLEWQNRYIRRIVVYTVPIETDMTEIRFSVTIKKCK